MMAINIFLDMNFFPDIIKMSWETQLERAGAGAGAGAVTMEIWNSGVATSGMPSLELGAVRLAWCHKNGILSFVQRRASMFPSKARICIGALDCLAQLLFLIPRFQQQPGHCHKLVPMLAVACGAGWSRACTSILVMVVTVSLCLCRLHSLQSFCLLFATCSK